MKIHASARRIFRSVFVDAKAAAGVITRKPILPTDQEMEENPRSKSAKLRVFENHKQKHNCTAEQRSFRCGEIKREKRKSRGGNVMSVRRRQHVSASTYVDGNTVRKVQRTVEIRPERDEREEVPA